MSTSLHGWLRLVWKMSDFGNLSQSCVRHFEGCVRHFKVAYTSLRCLGLNEACWGGVRIPLKRSICLLGLFWAFGLWFKLGLCSKLSLGLTYSKLFLIDKIVLSSGPGIPDFDRYKMKCLYKPMHVSLW